MVNKFDCFHTIFNLMICGFIALRNQSPVDSRYRLILEVSAMQPAKPERMRAHLIKSYFQKIQTE